MKYGDAVLYVRDRQALNALVAQSFQTEEGEVLNLIYLDPDASALGNQRMANFVQSAFSVKPLGPGMSFGWSPVPLDIVKEPPLSAPEQLDAVQGPVTPGDPASPHAIDNEALAAKYIADSGKSVHASDCATSVAPAETPGPCDCDVPQTETKTYADGTLATGPGPLPELSPDEQEKATALAAQINANLGK